MHQVAASKAASAVKAEDEGRDTAAAATTEAEDMWNEDEWRVGCDVQAEYEGRAAAAAATAKVKLKHQAAVARKADAKQAAAEAVAAAPAIVHALQCMQLQVQSF